MLLVEVSSHYIPACAENAADRAGLADVFLTLHQAKLPWMVQCTQAYRRL